VPDPVDKFFDIASLIVKLGNFNRKTRIKSTTWVLDGIVSHLLKQMTALKNWGGFITEEK